MKGATKQHSRSSALVKKAGGGRRKRGDELGVMMTYERTEDLHWQWREWFFIRVNAELRRSLTQW